MSSCSRPARAGCTAGSRPLRWGGVWVLMRGCGVMQLSHLPAALRCYATQPLGLLAIGLGLFIARLGDTQ